MNPRPAPDLDQVRELMKQEAEVVESGEPGEEPAEEGETSEEPEEPRRA